MARSLIALLLLVASAVHAAEPKKPERILVPRATKSPRVDGKLGKTEWTEALQVALADGGQARLLHDGKFLYIAMVGKKPGTGSICTVKGKSLYVMHASSALGSAVWTQKNGKSTLHRGFRFSNRDTTESQRGIKDRKAFLKKAGWYANAHPDTAILEREFQIAIEGRSEIPLVLSFLSFVDEDDLDLDAWPQTVVDGCVELDIASGFIKREYTFQPETWGVAVLR
ncbi:MAG TPA: hypothetical protein VGF28_20120 [Thermoanaerobaculia bacterium]|jgi:hypothetical protein